MDSEQFSTTDNSLGRVLDDEQDALNKIHLLLHQENNLVCPTSDVYLLKYLRYKKGDVDKAFNSILTWWKDRHRLPTLHDNLHPSCYVDHYLNKFSTTLSNRDNEGRTVVIWKTRNWDASKLSLIEMFKSNFVVVDTISSRHLTQLRGAVFVMDLSEMSMTHIKACTPSSLRTIVSLADGFPLKIKGIHFVNHPAVFNAVFAVMKMFMKNKMKKRVQFHGYDYKSLHEYVPKNILPKSLDGLLEEDEAEEAGFLELMLSHDQYYIDLFDVNKYGYHVKSSN